MNPLISDFHAEIDELSESFSKEFGNLSQEELNWKPNAETWSIAQNINHLILINESYYPIIKKVKEGSFQLPFVGKIGFITNLLGGLLLKSVEPESKKKAKTFPIWEPATSLIEKDIVERFKTHQEELKILIADSENLIEEGTVISSPANKLVVYKLGKAFEIMIAHEKRHLNQAKEVLTLQKEANS